MNPEHTDNTLVGKCPICTGASASADHNDAYEASTIVDSDKDVYLIWSEYYQQYVCRVCREDGINLTVDAIRDNEDRERDSERQKMGFVKTYTTN